MIQRSKIWRWAFCVLAVAAVFGLLSADAGAQIGTTNSRNLYRSQGWTGFRNWGTQGGTWANFTSRGVPRMTYPGHAYGVYILLAGPDLYEYWGDKGYLSGDQKGETYNNSYGEGVWVLARMPTGEYMTSYTGPRAPTTDIKPMYYDIAGSPEKDYGYNTLAPNGLATSNWWKGASPQKEAPSGGLPYKLNNFRYRQYVEASRDDEAEQTVFTRWTTRSGVTVTRKSVAFSAQGFDDFFINEITFENTGDSDGDGKADLNGGKGYDLADVYFAVAQAFFVNHAGSAWRYSGGGMPGDAGGNNNFDDWLKYTDGPDYADDTDHKGRAAYRGLKLTYEYDGDLPLSFDEDTGDPYIDKFRAAYTNQRPLLLGLREGQLMSYQFVGVAPLAYRDAGSSHVFNDRDKGKFAQPKVAEQPQSVRWYKVITTPTVAEDPQIGSMSDKQMYEEMTRGVMAFPKEVGLFHNEQTYGPYDLKVGGKAKVVVAYVAGSAAEFETYSATGRVKDMAMFARQGTLDQPARLAKIAKGEQAMVNHLKAAQFAYDQHYDIPDSPPDILPRIQSSESAQNQLIWADDPDSSPHPDDGQADIARYRVYRSVWQEWGPWEMVGEVPVKGAGYDAAKKQYLWTDANSNAGFRYFYSVRAVAKPRTAWSNGKASFADLPKHVQDEMKLGLEGGLGAPEQRTNTSASPVQPITDSVNRMEKKITVVPNPYVLNDLERNYGEPYIRFVGLPAKADIFIYSFSGDLVGLIHKGDFPGDTDRGEFKWRLHDLNVSAEVSTGVYFWVVRSLVPESLGKTQKGTFMVIK
jgi:hypothetical protein